MNKQIGAYGVKKFNYVTSNLPAVVNDESLELITKSLFTGKTGSKFRIQTGIKSTEDLHYLESELFYQTDTGCTFTASGDTSFASRTITVGKIKVQQSFCAKQLEGFWTEKALRAGSTYDYIAFEEDWKNYLVGLMGQAQEVALWRSALGSGVQNLDKYDGFLKIIDNASAVTVNGNPTGITNGTGITTANVLGIFQKMATLLPAGVRYKDDVEFMVDPLILDTLLIALQNANLYALNVIEGTEYNNMSIKLPAFGIKIEAYMGLLSTNRIILGRTSNFVIGTDLENDEDTFDIRQNPIDLNMLVDVHFKTGTQIALPNEIVTFKLV